MATREMVTSSELVPNAASANYIRPLTIVATLFFMWGFLTSLNDILVPHLKSLMILAAGITGLQVAANPYVLVLGKPETASSRLNLTQAFNSLGTTLAPVLGGVLILSAAPLAIEQLRQLSPQALHLYRMQQAASVKMPYIIISIALVLMAVAIARFKLPKIERAEGSPGEKINDSIWKHPNLADHTAAITNSAFDEHSPSELCRATVDTFVSILASEAAKYGVEGDGNRRRLPGGRYPSTHPACGPGGRLHGVF